MSPSIPGTGDAPAQVELTTSEGNCRLEVGAASSMLDEYLLAQHAGSLVCLPLDNPGPRRRWLRLAAPLTRTTPAARRARLPPGKWLDAAVIAQDGSSTPAVASLNVRRAEIRTIAASLGITGFFWAMREAPVEYHQTTVTDQSEWSSWSSVKRQAREGLPDLWTSLQRLGRHPSEVLRERDRKLPRWSLGLSALVGVVILLSVLPALLPRNGASPIAEVAVNLIWLLTQPTLVVGLLIGFYLRPELAAGGAGERDFNAAERAARWERVAPRLVALWCLAALTISVLQIFRGDPGNGGGIVEDTSSALVVCLWIILPIATAADFERGAGAAAEALVTAIIAILVLKFSLFLTDLFTDLLFGLLAAMLPFELSPTLISAATGAINFGAELFFLVVMLGYTWARTRRYFLERL